MSKYYRKAPWDPERSTFKSLIQFKNGKSITGYSKRQGFPEVKNKQVLLQNWVLKLYRDGYLDENNKRGVDEVEFIEFSWRLSSQERRHIFTLYQNYVEWNEEYYRDYLDIFFKKFYKLKSEGKDPYQLLYEASKSKESDPLDLTKQRFYSKLDLRNHCIRLVENNIREIGEVKNFYINYCNKFLEDIDKDELNFFESLGKIMSTNVD